MLTLEQATLMFRAATEELVRHGAIGIDLYDKQGSVHIFGKADYDAVPGEPTISYVSHTNRYKMSKTFMGVEFIYLLDKSEADSLPSDILEAVKGGKHHEVHYERQHLRV